MYDFTMKELVGIPASEGIALCQDRFLPGQQRKKSSGYMDGITIWSRVGQPQSDIYGTTKKDIFFY